MYPLKFTAVLLLVLVTCCYGALVPLRSHNFQEVRDKHDLLLVYFDTSGSGVHGVYKEVAGLMDDFVTFAYTSDALLSSDEETKEPHVALFRRRMGDSVLYDADLVEPKNFAYWVLEELDNYLVSSLKEDTETEMLTDDSDTATIVLNTAQEVAALVNADEVVLLLFTDRVDGELYESVAGAARVFLRDIAFGEVNNVSIASEFGVDVFPTLMLIKKGPQGQRAEMYSGVWETDSIVDWSSERSFVPVVELSLSNFQRRILSPVPSLILFVDPSEKKETKRLWKAMESVAREFKGLLLFNVIDGVKHKEFSQRVSITTFPSVIILNTAEQVHYTPSDMFGSIDEIFLTKFSEEFLDRKLKPATRSGELPHDNKEADVIAIVANTFDEEVMNSAEDVLVEFFAPWCPHCKQLAPEYENVGKALKDSSVVVAKYDTDSNMMPPLPSSVKIEGVPTIIFFPANDKEHPVQYNYDAELTTEAILDFVRQQQGEGSVDSSDFDADRIEESVEEMESADIDPKKVSRARFDAVSQAIRQAL